MVAWARIKFIMWCKTWNIIETLESTRVLLQDSSSERRRGGERKDDKAWWKADVKCECRLGIHTMGNFEIYYYYPSSLSANIQLSCYQNCLFLLNSKAMLWLVIMPSENNNITCSQSSLRRQILYICCMDAFTASSAIATGSISMRPRERVRSMTRRDLAMTTMCTSEREKIRSNSRCRFSIYSTI